MADDMVVALFSILTTPVVLLVLFAVTRMGAEGNMGRNSAVGIRIRATQRSDAAMPGEAPEAFRGIGHGVVLLIAAGCPRPAG